MRSAILITKILVITLRFVATGDSYRTLMYLFKVHFSSICCIVPEVCEALIDSLKEFIKVSLTVFIEILIHVNQGNLYNNYKSWYVPVSSKVCGEVTLEQGE
jgi:hypothetical protein